MSFDRRQYAHPVRKMQKANAAAQAAVLSKIPPELLDQLVKGPMTAEAVDDRLRAFKKALIERALGAEMSHHLGYAAEIRGTTSSGCRRFDSQTRFAASISIESSAAE